MRVPATRAECSAVAPRWSATPATISTLGGLMNRRTMIGGVMAAMATPAMLRAQDVGSWAGWWERSKRYTLQIAEAMPPADYTYAPFGNGTPEAVKSGDGAR